jgi:hypothetical protein
VTIEGFLTAKLDREQYAKRQQTDRVRDVDTAEVALIIPDSYRQADQLDPPRLDASLPWAEEIEFVVQQSGAEGAGVFYGQRVQLPVYANRITELTFGVLNRSRIPRKVNISFYTVERPVNSVMPTGRIFSQQYHFKPDGDAEGSKSRELYDWWLNSYARPQSELGNRFLPVAIAEALTLDPIDQIPPPATRERGSIINTPIEAAKFQKLSLSGPSGPPGPDGQPGPAAPLTNLGSSDQCPGRGIFSVLHLVVLVKCGHVPREIGGHRCEELGQSLELLLRIIEPRYDECHHLHPELHLHQLPDRLQDSGELAPEAAVFFL